MSKALLELDVPVPVFFASFEHLFLSNLLIKPIFHLHLIESTTVSLSWSIKFTQVLSIEDLEVGGTYILLLNLMLVENIPELIGFTNHLLVYKRLKSQFK